MRNHTGTFINVQDLVDNLNQRYHLYFQAAEEASDPVARRCEGKMLALCDVVAAIGCIDGKPGKWHVGK